MQQALFSVFSLNAQTEGGGVAYWAHAGGFFFGALIGPALGLFDNRPPGGGGYRGDRYF